MSTRRRVWIVTAYDIPDREPVEFSVWFNATDAKKAHRYLQRQWGDARLEVFEEETYARWLRVQEELYDERD